ncbi:MULTISPECIES: hypothetical protein [Mycobacterium]|uniref:Uncharacterized protein n=1 Tax=Mycobacterium kiyosense TaxID=2871094 RepID=A0A9P3QC32_9MYCO|nr:MULTISPECIES: hypothetical protein [Mycobacterium]BDB41125.1 hypothetical protein IWGMT90018_15710 [Mycobacterium kiyosense]BDE12915.1 hypothetical protein MKCMC460_17750 [Mycobacterium sp. 20KCMC460]GLB83642.1 hypothetical protein SRL2020028_28980 [Mycobacterium kiyosense]GLB91507.1 hypothetical protein SRL2020130_43240 [Mycobacterium kiyosense]GLB97476.1 hypothetical protein SRL2020226_42520 [Mycobacterium kiyosense]
MQSSAWIVPVSVAIIAAAATLIAAFIGYTKDRRDQRAQILQDLDIAEKLPEGSRAKEVLVTYADNRALLLPTESFVRYIAFDELSDFAIFAGVIALTALTAPNSGAFWRYSIAIMVVIIIVALRWRTYRRRVNNLTQQYLREQNLPADMFESVSALVWRSYRPWKIWSCFRRKR